MVTATVLLFEGHQAVGEGDSAIQRLAGAADSGDGCREDHGSAQRRGAGGNRGEGHRGGLVKRYWVTVAAVEFVPYVAVMVWTPTARAEVRENGLAGIEGSLSRACGYAVQGVGEGDSSGRNGASGVDLYREGHRAGIGGGVGSGGQRDGKRGPVSNQDDVQGCFGVVVGWAVLPAT